MAKRDAGAKTGGGGGGAFTARSESKGKISLSGAGWNGLTTVGRAKK